MATRYSLAALTVLAAVEVCRDVSNGYPELEVEVRDSNSCSNSVCEGTVRFKDQGTEQPVRYYRFASETLALGGEALVRAEFESMLTDFLTQTEGPYFNAETEKITSFDEITSQLNAIAADYGRDVKVSWKQKNDDHIAYVLTTANGRESNQVACNHDRHPMATDARWMRGLFFGALADGIVQEIQAQRAAEGELPCILHILTDDQPIPDDAQPLNMERIVPKAAAVLARDIIRKEFPEIDATISEGTADNVEVRIQGKTFNIASAVLNKFGALGVRAYTMMFAATTMTDLGYDDKPIPEAQRISQEQFLAEFQDALKVYVGRAARVQPSTKGDISDDQYGIDFITEDGEVQATAILTKTGVHPQVNDQRMVSWSAASYAMQNMDREIKNEMLSRMFGGNGPGGLGGLGAALRGDGAQVRSFDNLDQLKRALGLG